MTDTEQEALDTETHENPHYPYPVPVQTGEVVGGRAIFEGVEVQVRCGCLDSLALMYGHVA